MAIEGVIFFCITVLIQYHFCFKARWVKPSIHVRSIRVFLITQYPSLRCHNSKQSGDLDLNSLQAKDSTKTRPISLSWMWPLLSLLPVSFQVIHQPSEAYWRRRWGCGQRATEDPERRRTVGHPGAQAAHKDIQAETEAGSGPAVCRHPPWRGTIQTTCTRLSLVQINSLCFVKISFVREQYSEESIYPCEIKHKVS